MTKLKGIAVAVVETFNLAELEIQKSSGTSKIDLQLVFTQGSARTHQFASCRHMPLIRLLTLIACIENGVGTTVQSSVGVYIQQLIKGALTLGNCRY